MTNKTRKELIKKIGGQEELDIRAEHLLDNEVFVQADSLIEYLREKEAEIEWEYTPEKEEDDDEDYKPDFPEIFQHWIISEWLYNRMKEYNIAPVVYVEEVHLFFWGRTCCGQTILMDGTLQDVILAIEENL